MSFNPRTRESATIKSSRAPWQELCFNPRTRESATSRSPHRCGHLQVSIHALVRVRHDGRSTLFARPSFNPRTRESATLPAPAPSSNLRCFNPRTRESATFHPPLFSHCDVVSIHALVRVRRMGCSVRVLCPGFNPRTRESATWGARSSGRKPPVPVSIHALVRVRRAGGIIPLLISSFNPRTRESATVKVGYRYKM